MHQFPEFKNHMNIAQQYVGLSGSSKMCMLQALHVEVVVCGSHSTELTGFETKASSPLTAILCFFIYETFNTITADGLTFQLNPGACS